MAEDAASFEVWTPAGLSGVRVLRVTGQTRPSTGYLDAYGVVAILDGAFDGWYRGRVVTHRAGAIKLKEPGEIHRDDRVHAPFTLQGAAFAPDVVDDAAAALGLATPVHLAVAPAAPPRTVHAVFALHAALADPAAPALALQDAAAHAVTEVLRTCTEAGVRPIAERASRAVRRARERLADDLAAPVSLDELAAHAGLDKFHLVRAFRAEVGVPPYEYLTHLRVARASALLARGATVATVAQEVGLYDESQLHRHFRRITGIAPGRFARALRSCDARAPRSPKRRAAGTRMVTP